MLAFQIDLWSARGKADVRQKEIQFSSRARAATDRYKRTQKFRIAFASPLKDLPAELLDRPEVAEDTAAAPVAK